MTENQQPQTNNEALLEDLQLEISRIFTDRLAIEARERLAESLINRLLSGGWPMPEDHVIALYQDFRETCAPYGIVLSGSEYEEELKKLPTA